MLVDISTLNSHYERLQQLSKNEGTLDGLKSGAANCTGLFATEIAELEAQIEQEKAVIAESEEIIAAWISGIEDGTTQTILRLRFIHGLNIFRYTLRGYVSIRKRAEFLKAPTLYPKSPQCFEPW